MLAHGYYDVVEQHQLDLNAKYGWPANSCTALIPRGKWPPEWKCNLPNAMIIGNTKPAQYASSGDYIDAIRAGKERPPTRFPALYAAPASPVTSLISRVAQATIQPIVAAMTPAPPPAAPSAPPPPAGSQYEQFRAGCLQGLYAPNWCESVGLPGVPPFVPPPPPPPPPPQQLPPPSAAPPPPSGQLPQCPPGQYWGGYGCVPQGTTSSLLPQPYPPPGYPQPYAAGGGWWAAQAPNTKLAIVGGGAAAALLLVFMATRGGA
jgi:hypothetical protein